MNEESDHSLGGSSSTVSDGDIDEIPNGGPLAPVDSLGLPFSLSEFENKAQVFDLFGKWALAQAQAQAGLWVSKVEAERHMTDSWTPRLPDSHTT